MGNNKDIMALIRTVCCVGIFLVILISAIITVPKLTSTVDRITESYDEVEAAITNIDEMTKTLEVEVPKIVKQVESTMSSIEEGLDTALTSIEAVDFVKLNQAISDLAGLIRPLASFFGV